MHVVMMMMMMIVNWQRWFIISHAFALLSTFTCIFIFSSFSLPIFIACASFYLNVIQTWNIFRFKKEEKKGMHNYFPVCPFFYHSFALSFHKEFYCNFYTFLSLFLFKSCFLLFRKQAHLCLSFTPLSSLSHYFSFYLVSFLFSYSLPS